MVSSLTRFSGIFCPRQFDGSSKSFVDILLDGLEVRWHSFVGDVVVGAVVEEVVANLIGRAALAKNSLHQVRAPGEQGGKRSNDGEKEGVGRRILQ